MPFKSGVDQKAGQLRPFRNMLNFLSEKKRRGVSTKTEMEGREFLDIILYISTILFEIQSSVRQSRCKLGIVFSLRNRKDVLPEGIRESDLITMSHYLEAYT